MTSRAVAAGLFWALVGSSAVLVSHPVNFTFLDARRGWILVDERRLEVRRTTDGGRTWSFLSSSIPEAPGGGDRASGIVFADAKNGWLYGPRLYSTRDGGVSWKDEGFSDVRALSVSAGTVWIAEVSPIPILGKMTQQQLNLLESPIGRSDWRRLPAQPDQFSPNWRGFIVRSGRRAWASVGEFDRDPREAYVMTVDGARTWTAGRNPCPKLEEARGLHKIPGMSGTFALTCREGDHGIRVLRSSDGGTSWKPVGSKFQIFDNWLVFISSERFAEMSWRSLRLFDSRTGWSHDWVARMPDYEAGDCSIQNLQFIDARHGWFVYYDSHGSAWFVGTTDGGRHWSPHPLEPASAGEN